MLCSQSFDDYWAYGRSDSNYSQSGDDRSDLSSSGFKIHVDDILESWDGNPRSTIDEWKDWVDNHDRDCNYHPKREVIVVFILSLLGAVLPECEAKDFLHCKHKMDWYAACYVDKWTYVASLTWKEAQFCNAEVLLIVY